MMTNSAKLSIINKVIKELNPPFFLFAKENNFSLYEECEKKTGFPNVGN